ncbi:MAG: AIR synthase-related protein [Candidatus Helarchaeota archaeon]
MTDLEGFSRELLKNNISNEIIIEKLVDEYLIYKNISENEAKELAYAVLEEVINSASIPEDDFIKYLLMYPKAQISVGVQGVGCRGLGDQFVHELIARLSETSTKAYLSPSSLDDAGAVIFTPIQDNKLNSKYYIVSKMEGMHSRLSDFPFIAGFHVTRAALRDLYVKGADPISILIDIHLADDSDVGKLFDFMSGVAAVSELAQVPITGGSTLRIGGDMVIGTRIVGGISAVGIAKELKARRSITESDVILMTEGAGGGTIATTAIYGRSHEVVKETMNIKFLIASRAIIENNLLPDINCMCDVTNGGLRGDLHEISKEAKVGMIINEKKFKSLINKKVLQMLDKFKIDYLGVSLDALLIFCPKSKYEKIIKIVRDAGVNIDLIGNVIPEKNKIALITEDGEKQLITRYRESAYTKVKKIVGENIDDETKLNLSKKIEQVANEALEKREKIVNWIKNNQ